MDIQLDENLLTVVQCVIGGHPDLTPDLVDSAVRLLETGAALLAKNAKYGRLILNFVKAYRNQVCTSGGVYVLCTLYLLVCQGVTVDNSGLCCCVCVMFLEH